MEFTGERFIPEQTDIELEIEHLNRYRFARQFVSGKAVLDAACGEGYGSSMLAQDASRVVGIDISEESVSHAKMRYASNNTAFQVASISDLPFGAAEFDVVVSFETLEHVDETCQQRFLQEISRVLKRDGILVISTPNHKIYKQRGENHFHVRELEFGEFRELLGQKFQHIHFFSQQFEICNAIASPQNEAGLVQSGLPIEKAEYLVAVCSNAPLEGIAAQVMVRGDGKLDEIMHWAIGNHETNEKNNKWITQASQELQCLRGELEQAQENCRQEREQAEQTLADLTRQKEALYGEVLQLQDKLSAVRQEKENTWGEVLQLRDKENRYLNEIAAIKASRSWRVGRFFARFVRFFVPVGSKRAVFLRLLVTLIKHPGKFFACLTPKKIKKFFRLLRRGNVAGIQDLIRMNITGQWAPLEVETVTPELIPVETMEKAKEKTAEDYPVLNVPQWENPQVSIVIPVYNQFEFTYHCVESIIKNSGDISYEILIGNDCSTDLTTQIEQIIPGVRCITNEKNLRFVLNCKNAAKYAKGTYLLFLNNDTQVQPNWLEPLVTLIESADDIGMVGSKLVYPDGTLQEAGGILWRDGSAWNYGNRQNPALPEFNYVKEVDYISGAAIMLPRALWEEIGGFDERFVPAYCDDSDLAFTVRKMGYRVMLQPQSVVVHFEGVSNGTDTSSGQKQYQVVNMKKFYEKWKDVLEAEHFENGQNVFQARDRSRSKKTVLVVDHYIPTYDKDAGSRSMDHYIKLLVDLGFNVKFLGDNFFHDTQYAPRYEQWGVEILYGVYYRDHWQEWIKENGKYLDFVLLSRPHISIKYIDILRKYTKAKIVYYVQDLHFLREEREYEITKDPERLISAKAVKKQEMEIMGKSDVVFTLSDVEKAIIDQAFQPGKAVITPISYYSVFPEEPVDLTGKKGIIFVGGFGHHPNEDGVLWFFNEVWDTVSKALPECKVTIIGSKPTEKIRALASERVTVTGFVSDEELEEYYRKSRLCIIPLRYGAGVKGKTIEAMYHRIPLVSTSVGIEGLEGVQEYIQPADDAETFAQRVIKLYTDDTLAAARAEGYCQYLKDHNSYQSALALFADVFRKGE